MTTEALKSTPITNLDATPIVFNNPGVGAPAFLRHIDGFVGPVTSGDATGSSYRLLRVPSNAIAKHCRVGVDASATTFTASIALRYSDSTVDGTAPVNQGATIGAHAETLFGSAVDLHTAGLNEYVGNLTSVERQEELWKVCSLASDPGGYFDLTLVLTATTSGTPTAYAELEYTQN